MEKVIIIAGPTGVGKTSTSIALAKKVNGEIISADSMQIYRQMDIGTAKVMPSEMEAIPHHLIDVINPQDEFTVSDFDTMATKSILDIQGKSGTPIVVGGTGLYINSLIYAMDYNKVDGDEELRNELWKFHEINGEDRLYEMLLELDPLTKIEKQNVKRVIRAIEIIKTTGEIGKFTEIPQRTEFESDLYVLYRERENLYDIINQRVDSMINQGLVSEVTALMKMGLTKNNQSMKAIGYRQIIAYLEGEYDFDTAIELIKRDSRRYAKRQLTWFKRYKNAIWLNADLLNTEEMVDKILIDKK
ncbi:MAG: tRNA (adenosine(37)-N6)-dimethylallyltransferase MiaA [Proteocatella sp.]